MRWATRGRSAILVCALLGLGALAYALVTLGRPAGPTEAELLSEASRIARRLPLYAEPAVGALDDGPVPFRKHALYTPFWSLFLALLAPLGPSASLALGRLLAAGAWFVGVPLVVLGHTRGRADARALGLLAFAGPAGMFFLVRAGIGCNVDPLAVLLAAAAFASCLRARRMTVLAAVLLPVAVLLKPHVAGIGLGLGVAFLFGKNAGRARLGAALALALAGAAVLYFATGGAWPRHMLASSANPWSLVRFGEYVTGYGFALGAPHLAAAVWLLHRGDRIAGAGLLGSTVAAALLMAKLGSATNYWLEPTAALAVAVAMHEAPWPRVAWASAFGLAALALVLSARALPGEAEGWRREARRIEGARAACTVGPGEVWGASDPMLEHALAGRVTRAPWQLSLLVRSGRFPVETLEADLREPKLVCFAMRGPGLEGPEAPAPTEDGLYDHELWRAMHASFTRIGEVDGLYIYRRMLPPAAPH